MHLSLKNISKSYGVVKVLQDINFELLPGEVHAICGENGAGKSTLMNIISGNIQAYEGEVILNHEPIRFKNQNHAASGGIAIAYQHLSLFENLNVAENMFVNRLPVKSGLIDHTALYKDTAAMLGRLKISHLVQPRSKVSSLSAGLKQMIETGKALVKDPEILILDEPTASLSENNKQTLFEIIRMLKSRGVSVIYISHRMEEIFEISDRITILKDGKWIATAPAKSFSRDSLISLMVGREIRANKRRVYERREVLLEAEKISGKKAGNISFTIHKGEIVALAGLVGAGRSEIGKLLFGATKMQAGSLKLHGKSVRIKNAGVAISHKMAYVPEERKSMGLFLNMSIEENINAVSGTSGRSIFIDHSGAKKAAQQFKDKLRIVSTSIHQAVSELSGGNQQKVVLAKWLSINPDFLIVDEPTHGIDIGAKFEIYEILQELASGGKGILLISSELPEILALSDRVLVIKNGAITKELITSQTTEEEILRWAM